MGEAEQKPAAVKLHVMGVETGEPTTVAAASLAQPEMAATHHRTRRIWWIRVSIYIVFVLAGQSAATLLGRLYYAQGGNSKWMASLVECGGFPVLIPLYFLTYKNHPPPVNSKNNSTSPVSLPYLALAYTSMGILIAGFSLLYAVGLKYLPVSTFSLISASQLGFNALFSFFFNCQKFTPYILNSLVLLTLSSVLLVFQNPSSSESVSTKGHHNFAIGFLCTVGASAGYGLLLTLTQVFFDKVVRKRTFKVVVDVLVYPPAVASAAVVVGLFASGEWKGIGREMEGFELGKVSYVMTLVWTTICWQVFAIGCVGLIFEVSSLFSNVIGTFGLPVVPILAVVCFGDEMGGLKVVAMVLALWGFVSYLYQHYLDDRDGTSGSKVDKDGGRSSDGVAGQEGLGDGLLV